jgi:Right handed beta helix region
MKRKFSKLLAAKKLKKKRSVVLFSVFFALIGTTLILISQALPGGNKKVDTEQGDVSGSTMKVDSDNDGSDDSVRFVMNSTERCNNTWITINPSPTVNVQAEIDRNPAGTTYCLTTGTYRNQSITPKAGDTIVGLSNVVLNGSKELPKTITPSTWIKDGVSNRWYINNQTQEVAPRDTCQSGSNVDTSRKCLRSEDIFVTKGSTISVLKHQESLAAVDTNDEWFFDYSANRIYVGFNPAASDITAIETSTVERAIGGSADSVTIKNITVEKYANHAQTGAIYPEGTVSNNVSGWVIDGVTARYNHGAGFGYSLATNTRITCSANSGASKNYCSKSYRNGQLGVKVRVSTNSSVSYTEIYENNNLGFLHGWEAGGSKFAETHGQKVHNNFVHSNYGNGLWSDNENHDIEFYNNRVHSNLKAGIFHEVSYSAKIYNNVVWRNGFSHAWCFGAGIQIAASEGSATNKIEVYQNRLINNLNQITGVQQVRREGEVLRYINVVNNQMISTDATVAMSKSGVCRGTEANTPDPYTTVAANSFSNNKYCGNRNEWFWKKDNGSAKVTFAQWQALWTGERMGTLNNSSSAEENWTCS